VKNMYSSNKFGCVRSSILMFIFLAALALPGVLSEVRGAEATASQDPIVILNIADLHVTDAGSMEEFKQVITFSNAAIKPALTYIAGDTPDGGTLEEYQIYKKEMDALQGPVYNVAGDHEAKGGGMEHYRKVLGEPTYLFDVGRYHIIGLDSTDVDEKQLAWARKDLDTAKKNNLTNIIFIHHDFAGIKNAATKESLNTLVKEMGVKLVLAGHTHNNIVINDGAGLQITTTSLKAPKGKDPKGYALITLDKGCIAWHFIPLGQQPVIAICSPISKLMTTGAEGVVHGKIELRAKAFDTAEIKSVTASIDGDSPILMTKGQSSLWSAAWDSSTVKDGEHIVTIEAVNANGKTASEEISIIVNLSGAYTPNPATVSDGKPGGPKGPKDPKGPGPDKLGPPQTINGVVESFNFSPKGGYEGLLLKTGDKVVQLNLPPPAETDIAKSVVLGDQINALAAPDNGQPDLPVYEVLKLIDSKGREIALDGGKAGPPPTVGKGDTVRIEGVVKRLNHARHGEINGAVLENGDFVHLGPKISKEIKLEIGQQLNAEGEAKKMLSGGKVIEHPTNVNGKEIGPGKPPPPKSR
jgi:predicted phosphodiesterase